MLKYFSLLLLLLPILVFSQELEYQLDFKGIGDNREYFSNYNKPQSILGARTDLSLGTTIDDINQLRIGLSYFYEFGSELFELKPQLIMYYGVEKNGWDFKIGALPFNGNVDYPMAILADDYLYYNSTLDGLYVKYSGENWNMNVWTDWVSRQDSVRREQFMAGFSGTSKFGIFTIEDYFYMFHNAGSAVNVPGVHIEDFSGGLFMGGLDLGKTVGLDLLTLKTGVLSSLFRNRGEGMEYVVAMSSYSEIQAEKKGFGAKAIFNFGDEHHFSHGDAFFNNTSSYIRTNFYFTPINFERVKGRFVWSLHFANGDMDNQQQFVLSYSIGGNLKR